jgi:hypothetical protein
LPAVENKVFAVELCIFYILGRTIFHVFMHAVHEIFAQVSWYWNIYRVLDVALAVGVTRINLELPSHSLIWTCLSIVGINMWQILMLCQEENE